MPEKFLFPPYVPPHGGPHYWQTESSGLLPNAIKAYFDNRTENGPISTNDCDLVKAYIRHWINAPVWSLNPFYQDAADQDNELRALRDEADKLTDADSIDRWIHRALKSGIDPF